MVTGNHIHLPFPFTFRILPSPPLPPSQNLEIISVLDLSVTPEQTGFVPCPEETQELSVTP